MQVIARVVTLPTRVMLDGLSYAAVAAAADSFIRQYAVRESLVVRAAAAAGTNCWPMSWLCSRSVNNMSRIH